MNVTVELRLNNSTLIDGGLLCFLYFSENSHNYFNYCSLLVRLQLLNFYRAMHFSAKRGIAIACRLSVCLSVCNVGEL